MTAAHRKSSDDAKQQHCDILVTRSFGMMIFHGRERAGLPKYDSGRNCAQRSMQFKLTLIQVIRERT
jgi:hypothetical protein